MLVRKKIIFIVFYGFRGVMCFFFFYVEFVCFFFFRVEKEIVEYKWCKGGVGNKENILRLIFVGY